MRHHFAPLNFLFFLSFLLCATVHADSGFERGKAFFDAGKYPEAVEAFRSEPDDSAHYFFNLGTTYLKMGRPGTALAYLERANKRHPHDPTIQKNLRLAHTSVAEVLGKDRLDPASSFLESLADPLSIEEIRSAIGILCLILAILWLRAYSKSRSIRRTLLQPAGILGLIGLTLLFGIYAVQRNADASPPAFLVERQTVRSGPGVHFLDLGVVEAGVKVRLTGQSAKAATAEAPGWKQVRYSGENVGWIPDASLLLF